MAHTPLEELLAKLEKAKQLVEIGGHYTHYRAPEHVYITGFGIDEDTEVVRVEYQRIDEDPPIPWRRVLEGENGWTTPVEVDGKLVPRFTKVD